MPAMIPQSLSDRSYIESLRCIPPCRPFARVLAEITENYGALHVA